MLEGKKCGKKVFKSAVGAVADCKKDVKIAQKIRWLDVRISVYVILTYTLSTYNRTVKSDHSDLNTLSPFFGI